MRRVRSTGMNRPWSAYDPNDFRPGDEVPTGSVGLGRRALKLAISYASRMRQHRPATRLTGQTGTRDRPWRRAPRPPRRRSCIMRAASTGYPAHRKVHPPMPAPISSSSARAKSPRSISSSTPQPLELGGSAGALPPLPHSKLQTQGADGTMHAGLTTSSVRRSRKRGLCRNRAVGRPAVLNCSSSH
jgi:hypothetical protein